MNDLFYSPEAQGGRPSYKYLQERAARQEARRKFLEAERVRLESLSHPTLNSASSSSSSSSPPSSSPPSPSADQAFFGFEWLVGQVYETQALDNP